MDHAAVESELRSLCERGDHAAAADRAIRGYGPEVLGFLIALHRDREAASEVFSIWSERVFRGLGGFGWQSSFRAWAYAIARNASLTFQQGERRRARREEALPESAAIEAIAERVRTETLPYLRTEAKSRLAAVRDALPHDDRVLLMLRLEKGLAWNDLARVLLGEEATADEAELRRASQRLRKRFQSIKDELVAIGRREGLIGGDEGAGSGPRSSR